MVKRTVDKRLSLNAAWRNGPWAADGETISGTTADDMGETTFYLPEDALASPESVKEFAIEHNTDEDEANSPYAGCSWTEFLAAEVEPEELSDLGRDIVKNYLQDPTQDPKDIADTLGCQPSIVRQTLSNGTRSTRFDPWDPDSDPDGHFELETPGTAEESAFATLNEDQKAAVDVILTNPEKSLEQVSRDLGKYKTYASNVKRRHPEAFIQRARMLVNQGVLDTMPATLPEINDEPDQTEDTDADADSEEETSQDGQNPLVQRPDSRRKLYDELVEGQREAIDAFLKNPGAQLTKLSAKLDHDSSYISATRSKYPEAFLDRLDQLQDDPEIDNDELRDSVFADSQRRDGWKITDEEVRQSLNEIRGIEPDDVEDEIEPETETESEEEPEEDSTDLGSTLGSTVEVEVEGTDSFVDIEDVASVPEQGHDTSDLAERLDVAMESVTETIESRELEDPEKERLMLENYRVLIDLVEAKRSLHALE